MENAVPETGEHRQHHQHPIRGHEAHQQNRTRNQGEANQQHTTRPEPINEKPDWRLDNSTQQTVGGHRKTKFEIGNGKLRFKQGEQRRQRKTIKVAEEVSRTDQTKRPTLIAGCALTLDTALAISILRGTLGRFTTDVSDQYPSDLNIKTPIRRR